uniref:Uncharacterized protein n=1 Tax=Lotus japonicus TaxID=34305 RepID=I3SGI9_LOTJA|nr:unknown [Lotus japonicus]
MPSLHPEDPSHPSLALFVTSSDPLFLLVNESASFLEWCCDGLLPIRGHLG